MSKLSAYSGLGPVKAWCTAVHAPAPTATSPLATASELGSNIGASTTQVNANVLSSIRPHRRPISRRAAPSSARLDLVAPAPKKTQSPGCAPTWAASPLFSSSLMFFATGPVSSPSSWTST